MFIRLFRLYAPVRIYIAAFCVMSIMETLLGDHYLHSSLAAYVMAPSHGILIVLPLFLLTYYALEEAAHTCEIITDIRLPMKMYFWKPVCFSLLNAFCFCVSVFCGELLACAIAGDFPEMELLMLSFFIKILFFSVLYLVITMLQYLGMEKRIAVGLVYCTMLGDYIFCYTRGRAAGILFAYAFSRINVLFSWGYLLMWWILVCLILFVLRKHCYEYRSKQ